MSCLAAAYSPFLIGAANIPVPVSDKNFFFLAVAGFSCSGESAIALSAAFQGAAAAPPSEPVPTSSGRMRSPGAADDARRPAARALPRIAGIPCERRE